MSGVANRSETVTVTTPRGVIEVVRQQSRSRRANSKWELVWMARRRGQRDWVQAPIAREAIRRASLLAAGKQPSWFAEAAERAEHLVSSSAGDAGE